MASIIKKFNLKYLFLFGYGCFFVSLFIPAMSQDGGSIFSFNYSGETYSGFECLLTTYMAYFTWGDFLKFGEETYIELLFIPNTLILFSPLFVFHQKLKTKNWFLILFVFTIPQVLLIPIALPDFEYLMGFYIWSLSSIIIGFYLILSRLK